MPYPYRKTAPVSKSQQKSQSKNPRSCRARTHDCVLQSHQDQMQCNAMQEEEEKKNKTRARLGQGEKSLEKQRLSKCRVPGRGDKCAVTNLHALTPVPNIQSANRFPPNSPFCISSQFSSSDVSLLSLSPAIQYYIIPSVKEKKDGRAFGWQNTA